MQGVHPILTCDEVREFEAKRFAGDEAREWAAMQRAGRAVADAALRDMTEVGGFPSSGGRVLVLAGKGHNAGDALIAARCIEKLNTDVRVEVLFCFGARALRPLASRAWRELAPGATTVSAPDAAGYDLVLEGVFGFQFRPPLSDAVAALFRDVNALPARMRVAVDLPGGLDAPDAFRADFTYATGIVKVPALDLPAAGRLRYLDLGFFDDADAAVARGVLTPAVLAPLRGWRDSFSDKRTYGHLFVIGGSRSYPGAVLMNVLAALRSGVGLVTAFVPESLAPVFAARAPEAMWVGWPETPDGGLALEGEYLLSIYLPRATALLIGSGLGREPETLAMARSVVAQAAVPLVIDADALQPEVVATGAAPRVLTPHAGEFARIEKSITSGAVVIRKGPLTRIEHAGAAYFSAAGGPVLARGGSGDVLAGMTAGLLAQAPGDALGAACRATLWHGLAADALARAEGAVAVTTTGLLDYVGEALRGTKSRDG